MIHGSAIINHYERCWITNCKPLRWKKGPVWQMPEQFQILSFSPSKSRDMWTYATCGMSLQGDARPVELHMFSPIETDDHVELLTTITHYHLTGDYLDVGHTVDFGRPWLPGSHCDHGLISLPYLDGPDLEWLESEDAKVRFLWLIPISADEVSFTKQNGLEALESLFESHSFNFLDPKRKSVV